MNLKTQIISVIISFLYGFIIYKSYIKVHNFFFSYKNIYNFFNTFLYTIILTLIYFKIHFYINKGNISIIFILITLSTTASLLYTDFTKKM